MLTGPEFHDWTKSGDVVTAVGQRCFRCGSPCDDPGWTWAGETTDPIFLHLSCALKLQMDLNRDLHEYHRKTGTEPKST